MQKLIGLVLISLICLMGCHHHSNNNQSSINGVWESVGSGWILQIQDSLSYNFYDITDISCLPKRSGNIKELEESIRLSNDSLYLQKGILTYTFARTKELPPSCIITTNNKKYNPLYNFEVFAKTIEDHYAFFELNQIDWDSLYLEQRNKLSAESSEVELYMVLEETLKNLNDNHAFLEASDEVYKALELENIQEEETDTDTLVEYGDFQVAEIVAKNHLKEEMTRDSWLIQWGTMTDEIGYIQIKAMWLYADLDIPKKLIDELGYVDAYVNTFHKMDEGSYIQEEVKGVAKTMRTVMDDLSAMDKIVIDIRFNGGGQDAVSFEILSHFIDSDSLQVATQKLRYRDMFSPTQLLSIEGKSQGFSKPIYVLTSQQTASAAEALAIATMAIDNAKRIGERTSGAMSTALEKTLPNGWSFALSNELFMNNIGKNYENIGVPVDIRIDYPEDRQAFFRAVIDDLDDDLQSILQALD